MSVDEDLITVVDQRIRMATARNRAIGTCVSRATTGSGAMVTFDGSTVAMPVKVLGGVFMRPGDRCVLDLYGTEWIATGSFLSQGLGEASSQQFGPAAGSSSLTSSTFIDLTDITPITFDKAYDGTYVKMALSASAYLTVGTPPSSVRFGFRFTPVDAPGYTATDYNLTFMNFEALAVHKSSYYSTRQLSLPAGRYSVQLRWRRFAGTASVKCDGNDIFSLECDEGVPSVSPVL